ncbi:MAG TPA: hypothetical protein DCF68_19030 [Cyanothece sp. UBA12306]|nr:hypothetical protein [Cyanothece sp. UBA12306]
MNALKNIVKPTVIESNQLIDQYLPDIANNFDLVNTNNLISIDGQLNSWKIWTDKILPVQLTILRKDGDYQLIIGQSEQITPTKGLNEFTLSNPISVKVGDCVVLSYGDQGSNNDHQVIDDYKSNLEIVKIFYKGKVKRTQSDEYVEIRNNGNGIADLSNWQLTSSGKGQIFTFPTGTCVAAGQSIRVYTNEIHQESGGFSFNSKTAIWNDQGDVGKLFDRDGNEVSSFSYK